MKRLLFIVEGNSESAFVKEVLAPYLFRFDIFDARPIQIQTSQGHKGGFVNYEHLRRDILRILKSEKEVIVTSFVDFFRLPRKNFPSADVCFEKPDSELQVACLEEAMRTNIDDQRFIPYIQLHEYEALLFSSNKGFEKYFDGIFSSKTAEIISQYPNPEEINSTPSGAPSKRLLTLIPDYDKVQDGLGIAKEIGIETILQKCPRFNAWVQKLIEKTKSNTN
jgi:hypothetical protein